MVETEDRITKLQKKINKLEKKLVVLKEEKFKYKENNIVMIKENLLLVKIIRPFKQWGRKYYEVRYNHLPALEYQSFSILEEELEDMPFDYDKTIFKGYLDLLQKYEDLVSRLKKVK